MPTYHHRFEQLRDLQTTVEASLEWKDMYEQTTDAGAEEGAATVIRVRGG